MLGFPLAIKELFFFKILEKAMRLVLDMKRLIEYELHQTF